MIAILLAAGVGRRLSPFTDNLPKCLLEIGGKTLLARHLDALAAVGVDTVAIVIGHFGEKVREAVAAHPKGRKVGFIVNEHYKQGSILSLYAARHLLDRESDGALVMDADVLYPTTLLDRLVKASGSAFLFDERSSESGEEMMLGMKDGKVRAIRRRIGDDWDKKGENIGFFKVSVEDAPLLRNELHQAVTDGETSLDYEEAIHRLLQSRPAAYVPASDLPWTEIDFEEDVRKAQELAAQIDAASRAS